MEHLLQGLSGGDDPGLQSFNYRYPKHPHRTE